MFLGVVDSLVITYAVIDTLADVNTGRAFGIVTSSRTPSGIRSIGGPMCDKGCDLSTSLIVKWFALNPLDLL